MLRARNHSQIDTNKTYKEREKPVTTLQTTSSPREIRVIPLPHCIHASRFNTVLYYVSLVLLGGSLLLQIPFPYFDGHGYNIYTMLAIMSIFFIFYFKFYLARTFVLLALLCILWDFPLFMLAQIPTNGLFNTVRYINTHNLERFIEYAFFSLFTLIFVLIINTVTRITIKIDFKKYIMPFVAFKIGFIHAYVFIQVVILFTFGNH